jgi:DNA-binding NarL/FixJ family response regulator
MRHRIVVGLRSHAQLAADRGEDERAARLAGAADAMRGPVQSLFAAAAVDEYIAAKAAVRARLGAAAYDAACSAGKALTPDEAVAEALATAEPSGGAVEPTVPALRRVALSPRQEEILRLVARGSSNPEIAAALGISRRTVDHHLTAVYAALGVDGRSGAIAVAVARGLASDAPPAPLPAGARGDRAS